TSAGVGWLRTAGQLGSVPRHAEGIELLDRAAAILTRLLEADPDFHFARLARGETRFALDDLTGAKADYQYVRERAPGLKEVHLREAALHRLVYVKGGDPRNLESAEGILADALRLDPNYFDALFELGNVAHLAYDRTDLPREERARAFSRALLFYRRAMALNPRHPGPRGEWAALCLKAGGEALAADDLARAEQLLARVEAEAGELPAVLKERIRLNLRADYQARAGRKPDEVFSQAQRALERAEELAPDDPELPRLRGLLHRRRGWSYYYSAVKFRDTALQARARELAVEQWRAALRADPDDLENGSVRERMREIAPGVIEDDRRRAEAAYGEGVEAFREARWADAAARFREASALVPEWLQARLNLGLSLARTGSVDEALRALEEVANDPEGEAYPEAMLELGNLFRVRRQPLVASAWYGRYVAAMERGGRGGEAAVAEARRLAGQER
ncbi:MAG: hypothetical protein ACREID_06155, partial [Planctomycetota bacterium]